MLRRPARLPRYSQDWLAGEPETAAIAAQAFLCLWYAVTQNASCSCPSFRIRQRS